LRPAFGPCHDFLVVESQTPHTASHRVVGYQDDFSRPSQWGIGGVSRFFRVNTASMLFVAKSFGVTWHDFAISNCALTGGPHFHPDRAVCSLWLFYLQGYLDWAIALSNHNWRKRPRVIYAMMFGLQGDLLGHVPEPPRTGGITLMKYTLRVMAPPIPAWPFQRRLPSETLVMLLLWKIFALPRFRLIWLVCRLRMISMASRSVPMRNSSCNSTVAVFRSGEMLIDSIVYS
jgi:hypothetical protein